MRDANRFCNGVCGLTGDVRTGGNAYSQFFYYDSNGNRTKSTLGQTDTVYVYNDADQLTSEITGGTTTAYFYDANGALTKSDDGTTVKAYTYDCEGYQTAFDTTGTDNDATYTYDADRRRIRKVLNSGTTKYLLDGADVIADCDGNDTLLATYLTPSLDRNLSVTQSGSTYYYMADGLGSIRNVIDSSEATQNVYDYYAFGKELGTWTQNVTNRYTYTAREWDNESGQYYYRARHYLGAGRFLQRDPARNGWNLYGYVRNWPVNYSDPRGLILGWKRLDFRSVVLNGYNKANIPQEFADANGIWEQCCIKLRNTDTYKLEPVTTAMVLGPNMELDYWANGSDVHPDPIELENMMRGTEVQAQTAYAYFIVDFHLDKWMSGNNPIYITGLTAGDLPQSVIVSTYAGPRVFAHEIGHLLGVDRGRHESDPANLMVGREASMPGTRLTDDQCDTARSSPLLKG